MSSYIMENMAHGWRVQLGYDRPLRYYFVSIASTEKPLEEVEPQEYLYHNLHSPNPRLTPLEMEDILAEHNIGLPYELCRSLMEDGMEGNYSEEAERKFERWVGWITFYKSIQFSSPTKWRPRGILPERWHCLSPKPL